MTFANLVLITLGEVFLVLALTGVIGVIAFRGLGEAERARARKAAEERDDGR